MATDFYQVLDTSDVPTGVINIVTGDPVELGEVLAKHDDVNGLWVVETPEECASKKTQRRKSETHLDQQRKSPGLV